VLGSTQKFHTCNRLSFLLGLAAEVQTIGVSGLTKSLSGQQGETEMKNGFLNWKQAIASAMVLAALIVISAPQATAVEMKGMLKSKEVKALVANAKTPADHMKLARHFNAMAEKDEAEALEHEALAVEYTRNPRMGSSKTPMSPNSAEHCKYFAEHCRKAAKEMRAMAAAHEAMAKEVGK
jgi:hypothetical protein